MEIKGTPMKWALEGIRVVDLTSYIAGSYGAMMLGDLGAEVIKVESLEGDPFRELEGFFGWNRGKRSISANLKASEGRDIVYRLVARSDVVMENYRPGVAERLGVGYETLRAINPRLIYSSTTAFGTSGPYRDRPGFDPLLQAMGGLMALQGGDGPPVYLRIAVSDYYAAALTAQGVLAALFARERTGRGQRVETSLLNAVLALQSGSVVDYPGKTPLPRENPTYRLYRASDGAHFFIACGNEAFWRKLCQAIGRPDLLEDPRFQSWNRRREHHQALAPALEAIFGTRPCHEWLRILAEHDIPCAPVQSLSDFMRDPAVAFHRMTVTYAHPAAGWLTLMGLPIRLSETPGRDAGPPPTLGQHTDEVLGELGYAPGAIADLHARRIVAGNQGA
jgi:crotonobetainyl-CoA:carnitine CoA-transferase CaiB-like acyl-CoA transferase